MTAFLRTLAPAGAATLPVGLTVFAAAQGAPDGNPVTLADRARWWPVWLLLAPAVPAMATSLTGRAGLSLAWSAAALLLVAGMMLVKSAATD